jgi:hypothetical protein
MSRPYLEVCDSDEVGAVREDGEGVVVWHVEEESRCCSVRRLAHEGPDKLFVEGHYGRSRTKPVSNGSGSRCDSKLRRA